MAVTFPNALKLSLRTQSNNAEAAAATVRSAIGSGYKVRIYTSANTQIATGTASGSLGGSAGTITGSATVTFSAACDPATATYYGRIEKADGTTWLRGDVGLPIQGREFTLSKTAANADTATVTIAMAVPGAVDNTAQRVVAINCGGNAYTDTLGQPWLADVHFDGGTQAIVTNPIAGTADDLIYQSERWGEYSYSIPVTANKTYRVTLHLTEIWDQISEPGQRVFTVLLEPGTAQEVEIADIDVFALAGALNAYTITRDVYTTDSSLVIELVAVTQNPKLNGISITSLDGGVYVPPTTGGGGDAGKGTLAFLKRFKTDPHDARLGLMPSFIDWYATGRPYNSDTNLINRSQPRIVPWNTVFAAGSKIWPQDVGVEIGASEMWVRTVASPAWTKLYDWPTYTWAQHNRDDYGAELGVSENYGTAPYPSSSTYHTTNAGTKVVKRANNSNFPTAGTHMHCFYEGDNSSPSDTGRVSINRTLYSIVMFGYKIRAVGWPGSDGLAPITNPASNDGTSIVALAGADTYSANGDFLSTYGGDLGICRAIYVTNSWQWVWWYTCLPSTLDSTPPPWI